MHPRRTSQASSRSMANHIDSTRNDNSGSMFRGIVDPGKVCSLILHPGCVTGQYPGRHVRLENRRIFRVLMETHFPWSVFNGKTGFGLLSARRDQRRRRHGRKDPISKNLEKSSTFCEKSFMHRHFPATSWLPTAPSCTPNNPPCTPGAPWVDSDRRRWDSAFFGFPPFPPTRTPHPTTPYTLRTLDHRPDSESQPQPLFFHLARQTPRFWYTLKSGPVGGRDSAVALIPYYYRSYIVLYNCLPMRARYLSI